MVAPSVLCLSALDSDLSLYCSPISVRALLCLHMNTNIYIYVYIFTISPACRNTSLSLSLYLSLYVYIYKHLYKGTHTYVEEAYTYPRACAGVKLFCFWESGLNLLRHLAYSGLPKGKAKHKNTYEHRAK